MGWKIATVVLGATIAGILYVACNLIAELEAAFENQHGYGFPWKEMD